MNKFLKIILGLLLLLAIIGAVSYFSFMNAPKASSENKKVDMSISATTLFQEFEQDETASNAKYIGNIVAVKGTIGEFEEDENGATVLLLEAGDLGGVLCTLEDSQTEKAKALDYGDTVTVKGVCTGMLMEVVVNKGVLVE